MVWKRIGTKEQTDFRDKLLYKSDLSKQSEAGFNNYKVLKELCT